jgi:tetrahydromethanopterin S-methyltransferase subunit G
MSDQDKSILAQHVQEEMVRYAQIEDRLAKIESKLEDITEIWAQAKGALFFIKIMSGVGAAVAAIYVFLNSNFTITVK